MNETNMIAERIKELRKMLNLNQSEFCKKIGIKQSTLSSYENGTVSPSNEVLYSIAKEYNISLDWLFGINDSKISLSSMSDIVSFILQMDNVNEIRYELEINDHLFNDIETETARWYASLKFYGNDKEHNYNEEICDFLSSLNENRESFEAFFTSKEMFDLWKQQKITYYSSHPLTRKIYEELDNATRTKLRNEQLERQFKENQTKNK